MGRWLLAPIRAPLPLPLLPGAAEDASTKAGSAVSVASGNKRKATQGTQGKNGGEVPTARSNSGQNPFTIAAAGGMREGGDGARRGGKPPTSLAAGDYHLPEEPGALLRYEPGAIECSEAQYDELWRFAERVPPTPNPLNRHLKLRRKQATFGAVYKFGAQISMRVEEPEESWPELVRAVIRDSQSRVAPERRAVFSQAHVNWYPDGRAGMGRHRDAEPDLMPGAPIFSYSFLSDGVPRDHSASASASAAGTDGTSRIDNTNTNAASGGGGGGGGNAASSPRLFDVYRLGAHKPIAAVPLGHGDVLVMAGNMQETHEHGVRASGAKAHAQQSRVNITVRAFKPHSEAVKGALRRGGGE